MKHFKDAHNNIYAYEDNVSQDDYIKGGLVPINDDDLVALREEQTQVVRDALTYSEKRQAAYAALNQFEMQFDDAANSTTTWVDAINAIKQEFPK